MLSIKKLCNYSVVSKVLYLGLLKNFKIEFLTKDRVSNTFSEQNLNTSLP